MNRLASFACALIGDLPFSACQEVGDVGGQEGISVLQVLPSAMQVGPI
jgi:hypothetical protein